MLIFYDFEVYLYDWLVVLIKPDEEDIQVIVNDSEALTKYYEENKDAIFIGYNNIRYDQFIFKSILLGMNPKEVNDFIIVEGKSGWQFSNLFNKIKMYNYDVIQTTYSLKQLEGFMGNEIKETSVRFDIDRKLTKEELEETIKYCKSDVMNTIEVFMNTINDFNAIISLIKTFNLPFNYISKTKAQISAIILGCERKNWDDEFDISIVDTLKINKYKDVVNWFKDKDNMDYSKGFEFEIAGVNHNFGWGGVHGAKENYHSKGCIIHVDVTSYYPSLMIEYNFLTRNCKEPKKYKEIYDIRVALKKAGKKKEQAPYKIVLNSVYGICKDKLSSAYDPRQANNVCINGQLLLIDLIEKLESIEGFKLIQSNTDGLIVKIPDTDNAFNELDDICYEWEKRTRMSLGFDFIDEIWQKDVNNYIFRFDNGKLERKGGYVKELNELDNNLPIITKAVVDYLTEGIKVEDTINNCDDLKQFQMICKITNKYKCLIYDNNILNERCVRVFASVDKNKGGLFKLHNDKEKPDKFPSTPENLFIINENVNGKNVPKELDRNFYINMAKERLEKFGV